MIYTHACVYICTHTHIHMCVYIHIYMTYSDKSGYISVLDVYALGEQGFMGKWLVSGKVEELEFKLIQSIICLCSSSVCIMFFFKH